MDQAREGAVVLVPVSDDDHAVQVEEPGPAIRLRRSCCGAPCLRGGALAAQTGVLVLQPQGQVFSACLMRQFVAHPARHAAETTANKGLFKWVPDIPRALAIASTGPSPHRIANARV